MTDVLGVDPELDPDGLERAEHSLVMLGDRREASSQRRELPGQAHTLPQTTSELLGRVVRHCGPTRADHRRPARR